jgi:Na+/H+ antiporter NhaA
VSDGADEELIKVTVLGFQICQIKYIFFSIQNSNKVGSGWTTPRVCDSRHTLCVLCYIRGRILLAKCPGIQIFMVTLRNKYNRHNKREIKKNHS